MGAGRIAMGLVGAGGASAIAAYGSARSSYQPQPPVPGIDKLWEWVVGGSDPLALVLLAFAAVSAGLAIWQAFTALSKKDVQEVVSTDGAQTRAMVDEGIAQTWHEGQASEERDKRTHDTQAEHGDLLRQIVANQQADAARRGVDADKLITLASRIVEQVSDPAEAEQALHRAIDELLKLREEARQGTNFGDEVDEAIRRIFAKVEADDLDGAARAQEAEFERLAELVEEARAAQLKMADTGLSVARLRYDADAMAHWAMEKRKLAEGVDRLDIAALRAEQDEWYERALRQGSQLEMEVAIVLARVSIEKAINPQDWAACQNDLGIALQVQGQRSGGEAGVALLEAAVEAFRAALTVYTPEALPAQWAMTQNNLGVALQEQGQRSVGETGVALLEAAVVAYRAALTVYTRRARPADWAATQNNLGGGLRVLGERSGREVQLALLKEAVDAFRAALTVYTRDTLPARWAGTQNNLGNALKLLGNLSVGEAGVALLAEAVTAYRAALTVRTREALPADWAMTQNNLGTALRVQGERSGGEAGLALLAEAVAAYRAALTVRTREALPAQWAMTQFNLALVHESLGDLSDGSEQAKHWREAEASVLLALEIFDPVNMPYQHDQATRLLARIRAKLAGEQ